MITVLHANQDSTFTPVAQVDSDDLEFAWRWTQNIQDSWSNGGPEDMNEKVKVLAPLPVANGKTYGLRSTSMGDRMEINGRLFEVAFAGFTQVGQ
jgi:hypothetical protein